MIKQCIILNREFYCLNKELSIPMTSIFSHIFKKKDDQDKGERTKKIEVSPEQANTVKRLLENFRELDEEEIINFIENDPVLSKLPLKKRFEILETVKEYQIILEGGDKEEKKPEQSEMKLGIGSKVKIKKRISGHSAGDEAIVIKLDGQEAVLKIEFCEHKSPVEDLELLSNGFRIGDRVKIKKNVNSPKFGWGRIEGQYDEIGEVIGSEGWSEEKDYVKILIKFSSSYEWKADAEELEFA